MIEYDPAGALVFVNVVPVPVYVAVPAMVKVAAARLVLTEIVPVFGISVYVPENETVPPAARV